jgi:hypothetical protein
MKIECPVCGREGTLEVRGNSQRIVHYEYVNGKRVFSKHTIVMGTVNGNMGTGMGTEKANMGCNYDSRLSLRWARSSVRQSGGLLIRWPRVQIPPGPPSFGVSSALQT